MIVDGKLIATTFKVLLLRVIHENKKLAHINVKLIVQCIVIMTIVNLSLYGFLPSSTYKSDCATRTSTTRTSMLNY